MALPFAVQDTGETTIPRALSEKISGAAADSNLLGRNNRATWEVPHNKSPWPDGIQLRVSEGNKVWNGWVTDEDMQCIQKTINCFQISQFC